MDAATIAAEKNLAVQSGIKAFTAEQVRTAQARGGSAMNVASKRVLLRDEVARLILAYSPQEKHIADAFRVPVDAEK